MDPPWGVAIRVTKDTGLQSVFEGVLATLTRTVYFLMSSQLYIGIPPFFSFQNLFPSS